MTSQSFAIQSYVTKMEKVTTGAQLVEFITSMLNDPHLYVFGEVVENDKIKQVCSYSCFLLKNCILIFF